MLTGGGENLAAGDVAPTRRRRSVAPLSVALMVVVLAAIFSASAATSSYAEARAAGAFTPEGKRLASFALVLNVSTALAGAALLVTAIVTLTVRAVRRRDVGDALRHVVAIAAPLIVLCGGHAALNPWMGPFAQGLLRLAWARVAGGQPA